MAEKEPVWQVLKGEGEAGNLGARERAREKGKEPSSLLLRAWSRALIPFPFPFERLPLRLAGKWQRKLLVFLTHESWFIPRK